MSQVKTNTHGQSERHTVEVLPQGSPNGLYILIGIGVVVLLAIAGGMMANDDDTMVKPMPMLEATTVKPIPTAGSSHSSHYRTR